MKQLAGISMLLAIVATAGCATGKLSFDRCTRGIFGEMRCPITGTVEEADFPRSLPDGQHAIVLGVGAATVCYQPRATIAGTREQRRCSRMAYQLAGLPPVSRH